MKDEIKIHYRQKSAEGFRIDLNREVDQHLTTQSFGKNATWGMWLRVGFFLFAYWIVWALLALQAHSAAVSALLLGAFVFLFKAIAYNVVHDAVHQSISGNRRIDGAIYWISMTMLGPSAYLWRKRHNVDHHHYVNVPGWDSQIEGAAFFRFSPHQTWKPYHRYQHLYASLVYMLMTLHWIFIRDVKDMLESRASAARFLELILAKSIYVSVMIIIPSLVLPYTLSTVLLTFLAFHFILSWMVTVTFAVSHINDDLVFVMHDENGEIGHSYHEHQLLTSMDYSPKNRIVNAIFGGMSAHVAHHLYPKISSTHLREITKIVEKNAVERGLVYHEAALPRLVASHFRMLRIMGAGPSCGMERMIHPKTQDTTSGITTVSGPAFRNRLIRANASSASRRA